VRVPWKRLVAVCCEFGVVSVADGAHAIGHIDMLKVGDYLRAFRRPQLHLHE
jgi:selenocysteine lyase/cysteine desulfurase